MSYTIIASTFDGEAQTFTAVTVNEANEQGEALLESKEADVVIVYGDDGGEVGHFTRMITVEEARSRGLIE